MLEALYFFSEKKIMGFYEVFFWAMVAVGVGYTLFKLPNVITTWVGHYPRTSMIRSSDPRLLEEFPAAARLRAALPAIQEEVQHILDVKADGNIKKDLCFRPISPDKGWTRFLLRWHGEFTDAALQYCPRTCALLNDIGIDVMPIAMFSILHPGSKIIPHTGPYKGCWRYHLGLRVPDPADTPGEDRPAITVNGEAYHWNVGDDVLFDDTFMHSVNYPGTSQNMKRNIPRVILFADVQRKSDSVLGQKTLHAMTRFLGPLSAKLNKLNEKITQ